MCDGRDPRHIPCELRHSNSLSQAYACLGRLSDPPIRAPSLRHQPRGQYDARKSLLVLTLYFSQSQCLAGTQKVLYAFTGGADGGQPYAGVIFDPAGNLYGVTQAGGAYNKGTVFELSPSKDGWTETVLYSLPAGPMEVSRLAA